MRARGLRASAGLKAAWFLSHRIREAMRDGALAPMGSHGGIVEADETYLWKTAQPKPRARGRATPFNYSLVSLKSPVNTRRWFPLMACRTRIMNTRVSA